MLLNKYGPKVLVNDGMVEKYVWYANLKYGKSTASEKALTYGIVGYEKFRRRWEQIMERCLNPSAKNFHNYGGRGVSVSEEFRDCPAFVKYISELDHAYCDKRYQLDRIDNDRSYERGNLRWVTPAENCRNKRGLYEVIFRGEKMCLQDFVDKHTKLSRGFVRRLIESGVELETISGLPKGGRSLRYSKCRK